MTRGEIASRRFSPLYFTVWALLGAVAFFGLAAAFTPFVFLVVPTGIIGLLIIRRRGMTWEMLGLAVGLVCIVVLAVVLSS